MSDIKNAVVVIYIAGDGSTGNAIDVEANYVILNAADTEDEPDIEPRKLTTFINSRGHVDITWMLQLKNVRDDIIDQISAQLEEERVAAKDHEAESRRSKRFAA